MAYTGEQLEASAQLERARTALGQALGQTQDINNKDLDAGAISSSLASAVKEIYTVQSNGLQAGGSVLHISKAMEYMRNTLVLLQEVRTDDPALAMATSTVARILALLYPVSKTLDRLSSSSAQSAPAPREPTPVPPKSVPAGRGTGQSASDAVPLTRKKSVAPPASSIPPAGSERRSDIRHAIEVDIGIYSDSNFFTGFAQDISSGGLFVATYDTLPIGSRLNVNFSLPDGPVVSLNGKVRWVREFNDANPDTVPGMGIQFLNLSDPDRRAINQFMVNHPPLFYDDE